MASTIITARLSREEIAVIDEMVRTGMAHDRTGALKKMIAREKRRQAAERDAAVYAAFGPDPDLDALAAWSGDQDLDID